MHWVIASFLPTNAHAIWWESELMGQRSGGYKELLVHTMHFSTQPVGRRQARWTEVPANLSLVFEVNPCVSEVNSR